MIRETTGEGCAIHAVQSKASTANASLLRVEWRKRAMRSEANNGGDGDLLLAEEEESWD